VGSQFNIAVSLFSVGYILAQLPSNMILTRVRPSLYLPTCILIWSSVSVATGRVQDFGGLVAVRCLLGVVEAPFIPGVSIDQSTTLESATSDANFRAQAFWLLSDWYTRKELTLRMAIMYSALLLSSAFSSLLAAGILQGLGGALNISGWRWMFVIEGATGVVGAVMAFALLPDCVGAKTGSARWLLTDSERNLAAKRTQLDRVTLPAADRSISHGLCLAVTDYRTWIFSLLACASHSAYGFVYFFPT
jgi:hypothetical protein